MSFLDLDKGGRIPQIIRTYCGPSVGWVYTDKPTTIEYVIDGGGVAIQMGDKGGLICPDWCVVNDWWILADQVGSITMDIWKTTKAGYPGTPANSMVGSAPPILTNARKSNSNVLTGWNTLINQGDILEFMVASVSLVNRITIALECVRIIGQE